MISIKCDKNKFCNTKYLAIKFRCFYVNFNWIFRIEKEALIKKRGITINYETFKNFYAKCLNDTINTYDI